MRVRVVHPESSRWLCLAIASVFLASHAFGEAVDGEAISASEHVLILHGLARGPGSMAPLAERLQAAGFAVHNFDYPSTEHPPERLVELLGAEQARCCAEASRVHFVTHSLGGILVRALLADSPPENLGRVVQLAPPNHGSELVDTFDGTGVFELALGPTAMRLGTDDDSFPNSIGPPDYALGIIAGRDTLNPLGSAIIPGEDDGTVSIERARLAGARDFLIVDASHTFIMRDPEVGRQAIHFLRHGEFDREGEAQDNEESRDGG